MAKETTLNPVTGEIALPDTLEQAEAPSKWYEIFGVLLGVGALFLLLSLVSYGGMGQNINYQTTENIVGVAGEWVAHVLLTLFGVSAYLMDALLWIGAVSVFRSRIGRMRAQGILGMIVIVLFSSAIVHTALKGKLILGGHAPGGFFGSLIGEMLNSLVSTAGTYIFCIGVIVLVVLLVTDISLNLAFQSIGGAVTTGGKAAGHFGAQVIRAWRKADPAGPDGTPEPTPEDPKKDKTSSKKKRDTQTKTDEKAETDTAQEIKIVKKKTDIKSKAQK
jgi:hypothetical protein